MSEGPEAPRPRPYYWLTRFFILRLLGLVYTVSFLTVINQGLPLIGSHGLLPAQSYLQRVEAQLGSRGEAFLRLPSLFWADASDATIMTAAGLGLILSMAAMLGYANAIQMTLLWVLQLSINQIGQEWYSFGWEIQLLETGFLGIFMVPLLDGRPFPRRPPPSAVIWLYRWLNFRILIGAGLIKMRGDPCWRDLTCLATHYETQPVPGPLSRFLHFMPSWFHSAGVAFNHLVELVAPWFGFGPRRARHAAGILMGTFQVILILSGNLSFLNWLTIVPAISCLDDSLLRRIVPRGLSERADRARDAAEPSRAQRIAAGALVVLVAVLSINPIMNLMSPGQAMNTSFDPLHLVNTYGAFGSVGRQRAEIIFEGTSDAVPSDDADWKPYEFPCKPGNIDRRPCFITPYHYRLDWLMWFAAMSEPSRYPWTLHLVWKLLNNDPGVLTLMDGNPFPGEPPRYIRARLFHYEFAPPGEKGWWRRKPIGLWLPPLSKDDPRLRRFLSAHGWLEPGS